MKRVARIVSGAVAAVLVLAGCGSPLSSETIDMFSETLGAPQSVTVTAEGLGDRWEIDANWGDGLGSYQVQQSTEDGSWFDVNETLDSEFELLKTTTWRNITGFSGGDFKIRVREVDMYKETRSPWTEGSVTLPASGYLYEVEGTGGTADITYRTSSGTAQASIDLPLKRKSGETGVLVSSSVMPYISAQNGGTGSITCRITLNGKVIAEVTSSGQYQIATCSPR